MQRATSLVRLRVLIPRSPFVRTAVVYLLLTGYFYSFAEYGFNLWDEGGFANGTLRTLNGEKALEDFNPNGYLPGRYWYAALFFKLFGTDVFSLRLAVLLFTPAMVLLLYAAARRLMPPGFAVLAALCVLSAPSMYYNRFFPFFTVLNLFLLINAVEKRRMRDGLWVIAAIFLSGCFKIEIALITALVSAIAFFSSVAHTGRGALRPQGRLALAAVLTLTALLFALAVYFFNHDYFRKVFQLVFEAHRVWGNPFPELLPFFPLWHELGAHAMFERILFYLPVWTYAGIAVLLGIRILKKIPAPGRENLKLFIVLAFGVGVYGLVIWRAGFDNLLRTLPPFYILFCYGLHRIHEWIVNRPAFASSQTAHAIRKRTVHALAAALPLLFVYEMNTRHGFYAGSIGALNEETRPVQLDRMNVRPHPTEALWLEQITDRIEIYTDAGDPILALPLNPVFYFLTGRINPTPYDWILPGMLDADAQTELVTLLKRTPPKLVVYVDIPIDGKEERRLSNYAPVLFAYIAENYRFEEIIGLFQILLPKEPETARGE